MVYNKPFIQGLKRKFPIGGFEGDRGCPEGDIGEILDTLVTGVSPTLSRSNSQSVIGGGSMVPTPTKNGSRTNVSDVLMEVAMVLSDEKSKQSSSDD